MQILYLTRFPTQKFIENTPDNSKIISDNRINTKNDRVISYSDADLYTAKFFGLTRLKKITAWDKAFYHLSKMKNYGYVWLIEDDVFIRDSASFFSQYEDNHCDFLHPTWMLSRKQKPKWDHWKLTENRIRNPYASVNYICRLSETLVNKVLEFRKKNEKFIFHEILFSSIAHENFLKTDNMDINEESKKYLRSGHQIKFCGFDFRNILNNNLIKIAHPCKDWAANRQST